MAEPSTPITDREPERWFEDADGNKMPVVRRELARRLELSQIEAERLLSRALKYGGVPLHAEATEVEAWLANVRKMRGDRP